MYGIFSPAAESLGWSVPVLYSVGMVILGIGMGVGILVATGSILAGTIGACVITAIASGTGIIPFWIPLFFGIFMVFALVVSRSM